MTDPRIRMPGITGKPKRPAEVPQGPLPAPKPQPKKGDK